MTVEIRGLEQIDALAKSLNEAERSLRREFLTAAQGGARQLEAAAKQSALQTLPRHGGLAQTVANSIFTRQVSTWRYALQVTNRRGISSMNRGRLRHPVYGHRDRWVTQQIRRGWWDAPVTEAKYVVEDAVQAAMERVGRRIERRR